MPAEDGIPIPPGDALVAVDDHLGDLHVLRKLDTDDLIALVGALRRDRHLASEAADAAAAAVGAMADRLSTALAENVLLRVVANAARAYVVSLDSADPTITRQDRREYMAELRRALRAERDGVS